MRFWKEFEFYMLFALGVTLFVSGFLPLFKVASVHIPVPGLRQALASR